jgi:imidazolonepropionase-like amidohydrolase
VSVLVAGAQPQPDTKPHPVVIRAGTLLDGKGHTLHDVVIVVRAGKVVSVEPNAKDQRQPGGAVYELSHLTVMPGWIDLHDHITWHQSSHRRQE